MTGIRPRLSRETRKTSHCSPVTAAGLENQPVISPLTQRPVSAASEALLRGLIPWLPAVMNILSRVEMPPVRDHSGKPSRASCGRVRTDTALDPGRNTIRVRNIFRAEATLISEKHCFYPSGTRNAYDSEWVRDPQRSPFLAAEVLRMALFSHKSDTCRGAVRRLLSRSKKR